jgi:hypothetical protein
LNVPGSIARTFGGFSMNLLGCSNFCSFFKVKPKFIRPMMFGSNLKRRIETRCFADAFGGCWLGIRRLGKKIGSRKIPQVFIKKQKFSTSYLFTKSTDPCLTTPKKVLRHLDSTRLFSLFPNIIGIEGRSKVLGTLDIQMLSWEKIHRPTCC